MARKPTLSIETLVKLGPEKPANIIPNDEADNPAFRKRVNGLLPNASYQQVVLELGLKCHCRLHD